jgi:hypothetical protein
MARIATTIGNIADDMRIQYLVRIGGIKAASRGVAIRMRGLGGAVARPRLAALAALAAQTTVMILQRWTILNSFNGRQCL